MPKPCFKFRQSVPSGNTNGKEKTKPDVFGGFQNKYYANNFIGRTDDVLKSIELLKVQHLFRFPLTELVKDLRISIEQKSPSQEYLANLEFRDHWYQGLKKQVDPLIVE